MNDGAGWHPTIRVGMPLPSGRLMDLGVASGLPMLVSANAFSRVKGGEFEGFNLRAAAAIPASCDVALDSAGFVACARYGGYRWTVDQYLDLVAARHWSFWAACDYCVEPEVAGDAAVRRLRIEATVSGYFDCLRRAQARGLGPPLAVCQGRYPDEYVRCVEQLALDPHTTLLGVGSVCRRHLGGPDGLVAIVRALDDVLAPGVRLHLFGVKGGALRALRGFSHRVASVDSMAYDFAVRRAVPVGRTQEMRAAAMVSWHSRQSADLLAGVGGLHPMVPYGPRSPGLIEIAEDAVGQALAGLHTMGEIDFREASALVRQDASTVRAVLAVQGVGAFQTEEPCDDFGLGVGYRLVREALIANRFLSESP